MRRVLLLFLLAGMPARADLYRWVDPQTGSVKFSSVPPPASQPGVQLLPYRDNGANGAGTEAPRPAPPPAPSAPSALELRWREALAEVSAAPPGSPLAQQRLRELAGLTAELDRADPAGATQRHDEAQAALQRLLKAKP